MKTSGPIKYERLKSGGYRLLAPARILTSLVGKLLQIYDRDDKLVLKLDTDGTLWVEAGYQWDGASGPVIDRKTNMRAGLFHDALYQLMRSGYLPQSARPFADGVYRELYEQDGGWAWIGELDFLGLRLGAGYAAKVQPEAEDQTLSSP